MAYIDLGSDLPGVTGLLEYRKDTGDHLRELTQLLLRGPSTLTAGERELIATVVSNANHCTYCTTSHAAAADAYVDGNVKLSDAVRRDYLQAPISDKMKSLLTIALHVQESGTSVTSDDIAHAKSVGASDREIHDTVMIAALFCFYNRYVDGLGTYAPTDPEYYRSMAIRLRDNGYGRPPGGYQQS